ncbi:nucleotide-diphospho-sugar transferase [Stemphylium lycopersici]|uniref:Nucleotide-diphospho-sugar transferase n=1 Tax=Stemphylium lycopersici TaxID=183478 RepID=A0A364MY46_STELY|nr:rna ligase cyclic nucleotide phosphodiesterase [Stemphylium lycopersici]RAR05628.1 nucleotide-diphospho-sugar transferase [Stemphylium lycopersici]RAR06947.1 nucleotide-diphospho-sugar transferase [Stemphylium lycopersici]
MAVTYAAAITTPSGGLRQPQIQARACSDPDMRASFEASAPAQSRRAEQQEEKKPQRPGAGIRAKTSFRGWASKSNVKAAQQQQEQNSSYQPYIVEESRASGHYPRTEHKPNTESEEEHVYVLTLKLTDSLAKPMDELRNRYFPKRLNRTGAHLTLFHALPESQMEALERGLAQISGSIKPFDVSSGKPFRMRKGVGINVDEGYKKMKDVHSDLQSQWAAFLSEQDAGGFRPHWTVMNKVDDEHKVDGAFSTIRQELSEGNQEGQAVGLDLWRYERGNWIFAKHFLFGEAAKTPTQANAPASPDGTSTGLSPPPGDQSPGGGPGRRPGMFKRGSSVGNALRSMSFRKRS